FGISTEHYKQWPWQDIVQLKQYFTWKTDGFLQRPFPDKASFAAVNFDQLIHVRDIAAVTSTRAQLRDYIWGRDQGAHRTKAKAVQPPSAKTLSRLGAVMGVPGLSLVVDGQYGYRGEAFVWFAKTKADCLFVYAQGHGYELLADYGHARQLLKTVLNEG